MSDEKTVETVNTDESTEQTPVESATDAAESTEQTSVTEKKPTKEEFETLLNEGKKALLIENFPEAIEKLADASAISVELFGEFASETFAPHYNYGKALLEVLSTERDLLELKLKNAEENENDPILGQLKEGLQTLVQQMAENQNVEENEATAEDKGEEPELKETTADESNVGLGNETTVEAAEIDVDQTANNEEDLDEEIENAQLAFETLDYARLVCEKNLNSSDASTWLGRQKDTLVLLGQVALNDDNFETALQDLGTALKIVNENFASDLREVAFINMELSRVLRKTNDFSSAVEHIENAINALEQFKAKIQAEPQNDEGKLLNEITEILEEVLSEKELLRVHEADKENTTAAPSTEASVNEVKPIDTLSIKRKEKRAAPEDNDNEAEVKKAKVEA